MEELLASLPPEVKEHVEYLYSSHRSRVQQQQQQQQQQRPAGDMPKRGSEAGGSADSKVPVSAMGQDKKAPAHRSVTNGGEQEAAASVPSEGVPDDSEGVMGRRARESISRMAAVVEQHAILLMQQHKLLLSNSASWQQVLGELRGMREERAQERRERKEFLEEVRRVRETWTQDKVAHEAEAAKFYRAEAQEGHDVDRSPTEEESVSHSLYLVTI